jgi:protein pelota
LLGGTLRVRGRNLTECEHVKLGAYHTLELEPGRAFTLHKHEWDALDIDRVRQACDPSLSADLAAVLIADGLAQVMLVGSSTTLVRARIEANLPRKRGAAAAGYDKALEKFHSAVFDAVLRHVDFSIVRCLVIAGPGFAKDALKAYLDAEAVRRNARPLIENKSRIVVAPASSAYKGALKEVLESPAVAGQIKDTKAAREVCWLGLVWFGFGFCFVGFCVPCDCVGIPPSPPQTLAPSLQTTTNITSTKHTNNQKPKPNKRSPR